MSKTKNNLWAKQNKLFRAFLKEVFPKVKEMEQKERQDFYKSKRNVFHEVFNILVPDKKAFLNMEFDKQLEEFKNCFELVKQFCETFKKGE